MATQGRGDYDNVATTRPRDDGQGSGCGDRRSGVSVDIVWEERIRTLKDLVTSGKYPCVVKVQRGEVDKYLPDSEGEDGEACVLQVLEMRRHKMLTGDRLQWERKTGEYVPTGKRVELPVTQKGWFEVLPENGQPVEYFDTINAIVNIRPKQFLVRTSIVGYQLSVDNGVSCWVPWEIRPGEVLTTGIVHMDHKKTKKKKFLKRIFSSTKGGKKEQELKYLQCFDCESREIMIPLIMTGVFSPVGDSASANFDAVYSLHDLLMAFNLPIQAQLIHTDSQNVTGVPSGMLRLETMKDVECLLVAKYPYIEGESGTFEVPVSDNIILVKEKKKKTSKKHQSGHPDQSESGTADSDLTNGQVDLPIRVKDSKRSKGSAILEKLSVRSRGRKERASLKALQETGVFSSRLSKNDINYEEFFGLGDGADKLPSDDSDVKQENMNKEPASPTDEQQQSGPLSKREIDIANDYSVPNKRSTIQDRDLPPIPQKTKSPRHLNRQKKESIYEELPMAPLPPSKPEFFVSNDDHGDDCDGYMTPARLRQGLRDGPEQELEESQGRSDFDAVVKRKPPTAPRDSLRFSRARRVKSEFSPIYVNEQDGNFDQMFDYGYNDHHQDSVYERRQAQQVCAASPYRHTAQFEEALPTARQRAYLYDDSRKFHDDTAIEHKPMSGLPKFKSRSHKNLHVEGNATIRSHNVRKMRTAMEVFNFSDSLRDLRQPVQSGDAQTSEPTYGRVVDNERVKSYVYGEGGAIYGRQGYAESEPAYRKYQRSGSYIALSETFPKHGDDSAISLCSRGEYGFPGESEYSYSEYSEWQDDGWTPPVDIGTLSVLEVSKSLRYIGMKDRVVIRFAHEQIDGNMLCSLDKKLLKEGFPELNALEIKKILDFVGGWRPKK